MESLRNKILKRGKLNSVIVICTLISLCLLNQSEGNNITTGLQGNHSNLSLKFECPTNCSCKYEQQTQDLRISCHIFSSELVNNDSDTQHEVDVSNGVRQLRMTNMTLNILSSFQILSNSLTNNLEVAIFDQVIIDPVFFFNFHIFRNLKKSLKRLEITKSKTTRDGRNDDPINIDGFKMIHFSDLDELDSLTLCDNSPTLSKFLLNSLPQTHHITLAHSSISDLDLESFNHHHTLKSLNLSNNRIHTIPMGLGDHLPQLTSLDFSYNHIEHLQEDIFLGLTNLQRLNVSNNKIRYIDTEVFIPLISLEYVDISRNEILQIFDPYFEQNKKLRVLLMSNAWSKASFADEETALRSLNEINRLLSTLQSVEVLDLSDNHLTTIPESLTHMPNIQRVYLHGNLWKCTCDDRWILPWLSSPSILIKDSDEPQTIWCSNDKTEKYPFSNSYVQNYLNCTSSNIISRIPIKFFALIGKSVLLKCHPQKLPSPLVTWITPKQRKLETENIEVESEISFRQVFENGSMYISNVTTSDLGLYLCIVSYDTINLTHYIHLGMDTSIFLDIKYISIIVGWMSSIGFLLAILTVQLVRYLLTKCGLDCPKPGSPYNARRVRTFFESIEQHNNSQLDWLRDNYNMQAKRIKDNCLSQLERIRESYTTQTKNLSEIRDYGTQQLHTIRDQYFDQIRRVSSYSTQHLCRVRENYLFQRNRVCKFSSHQLLKLRETYKWQAQTLNKILENLPNLNFDTCRGMGACGRTESIYLNDIDCEFLPTEVREAQTVPDNLDTEKMEHVSLLIPAESIKQTSTEDVIVIVDSESKESSTQNSNTEEI